MARPRGAPGQRPGRLVAANDRPGNKRVPHAGTTFFLSFFLPRAVSRACAQTGSCRLTTVWAKYFSEPTPDPMVAGTTLYTGRYAGDLFAFGGGRNSSLQLASKRQVREDTG